MTVQEADLYTVDLRADGWFVVARKITDLHPYKPSVRGWSVAAMKTDIWPVIAHAPTRAEALEKLKTKLELGQFYNADED